MSRPMLHAILNECRHFGKKEIRPSCLAADAASDWGWAKTVCRRSAVMDIPNLMIPENPPQVMAGARICAAVLDVLAFECASVASILAHHFAASIPLVASQSPSANEFAVRAAGGDEVLLAGVLFPDEQEENGLRLQETETGLALSGSLPLAGNAFAADWFCLFLDEGSNRPEITCLLVRKNQPGVAVGPDAGLPGLKANPFAPMTFTDVAIPPEAMLAERGKAGPLLNQTRSAFWGFIAATAMGCARKAFQTAHTHAAQRYQFGRHIIRHPEIQRMLGQMLMKLNVGTAAYESLFQETDRGLPFPGLDAGLMKGFCADCALEIALDAVQIHGGYGYMQEYGVEKLMRDAKVLQLLGGGSTSHQIRCIAKGREAYGPR
ncbi:MAG: acyl-CoA dehydrogenase family protein [Thermodesulfobacteriota bacterium]